LRHTPVKGTVRYRTVDQDDGRTQPCRKQWSCRLETGLFAWDSPLLSSDTEPFSLVNDQTTDPVCTSPARLNVAISTPRGED
jgi:hypothetical protein